MLEEIHKALVSIRTFGPRMSIGICFNVARIINATETTPITLLCDYIKKWPKIAIDEFGCTTYPVEGSFMEYNRTTNSGDSWDKTKEAGKRRYELLDFLIEKIGEDLKNDS